MTRGIENLRKFNEISIIVYLFTYLLAFFNVEEMLIAHSRFDANYSISNLDRYSLLMMWVGIAFTLELIQHILLRRHGKAKQVMYVVLNLVQIGLMGFIVYRAHTLFDYIGTASDVFSTVSTICILCVVLSVFMVAQILLCAYKTYCSVREYGMWDFKYLAAEKEIPMDKDSRRSVMKVMRFSLVLATLAFYIWHLSIWICNPEYLLPMVIVFPIFAFIIPFAMFIYNMLSCMLMERRYMHAVVATVLYAIAFCNVFGLLMDKVFYDGGVEIQWFCVIIEAVILIVCAIAIYLMVRMYREPIVDEQLKEEIAQLNGKKPKKLLIALVAFLILCSPIGIYHEEDNYTYATPWYGVTYVNTSSYVEEEYDVCHAYIERGIEVRIIGFKIFGMYTYIH